MKDIQLKSLLPDVSIRRMLCLHPIKKPVYSNEKMQVSQSEFYLDVPGLGVFYARDGKEVQCKIEPDADPEWVNLYLNGQVLVALLHQRKIISFHASSFIYKGRGIMILGDTGAGKSSLTASFILHDADFLSDDLTPVVFLENKPFVFPLNKSVKIDEIIVRQLNIKRSKLLKAEKGTGKYYFALNKTFKEEYPLQIIFHIEPASCEKILFLDPQPAEKFSLLRSGICFWEILAGMQQTESVYFKQLISIVNESIIIKVLRPEGMKISNLHNSVLEYLNKFD